jgi:hypothetical protein
MSVWAARRNRLRLRGEWGVYVEAAGKKDADKAVRKTVTKKKRPRAFAKARARG